MTSTPQRRTRQRSTIAGLVDSLDGFRTAQDIHELLRARGESVGLATVYRALQTMAEAGEVDMVRTPDGQASYRACGTGEGHHHHHLICRSCGTAVEFGADGVESLIETLASRHGFTDVDHSLELHGVCAACANR